MKPYLRYEISLTHILHYKIVLGGLQEISAVYVLSLVTHLTIGYNRVSLILTQRCFVNNDNADNKTTRRQRYIYIYIHTIFVTGEIIRCNMLLLDII